MGFGDFIKEPDAESYYVPPPQLPAVVFTFPGSTHTNTKKSFDQRIIFGLTFAVIAFLITSPLISPSPSSFIAAALGAAIIISLEKRIHEVYLTSEYVVAKYGFRKRKEKTAELHSHFILINEETRTRHTNQYSYYAYLMPKSILPEGIIEDGAYIRISKQSRFLPKNMRISRELGSMYNEEKVPISPNIYTPENLKEYVEGINSQLSNPLPIVFGSEQVKLDYTTGKYKAKSL